MVPLLCVKCKLPGPTVTASRFAQSDYSVTMYTCGPRSVFTSLWVELEATVFSPSGIDLVSSGCSEFGVSTHTDLFPPAVWTCTIQNNILNVWFKMRRFVCYA
jgi:hypothetical protein